MLLVLLVAAANRATESVVADVGDSGHESPSLLFLPHVTAVAHAAIKPKVTRKSYTTTGIRDDLSVLGVTRQY